MDYTHTHPHSPFTAVPVKEKKDRQPFNVSERGAGLFMHILHLTAGTISNQSLHFRRTTHKAVTHSHKDTSECITKLNATL